MDASSIAAVVASIAAVIGPVLTYWAARRNIDSQAQGKAEEVSENAAAKLRDDLLSVVQRQDKVIESQHERIQALQGELEDQRQRITLAEGELARERDLRRRAEEKIAYLERAADRQ
ncbi:MAG: hypothetical protein AB7S41_11340 [Parvibaculaceae bacterium]